jgi:hypothetical protein
MSRLTEALESFYNLLCLEYPEIASRLQPDLTREEIDEKVKSLGFSLPEEVYELYQWRNGMQRNIFFAFNFYTDNEFNMANFYSLEGALNSCFMRSTPCLIPLFSWYDNMVAEGGFFAVHLEREGSHVVHYNDILLNDSEQEKHFTKNNIVYSSLINLVSVITECYEEALLSSSSKGLLLVDKHKFEQIHLKYKAQN